MSAIARKRCVWGARVVALLVGTLLLAWDSNSTVARKLKQIGLYGIPEGTWEVVAGNQSPALLDPVEPPAPQQNSVVGICQSTDTDLGGLAASLTDTLTYAQVDSVTRLAVQRAGGLDAIVNPGDWVVIKPNILNFYESYTFGYPDTIVQGTSTDLRVVKSLIQQLVEEGDASRITVSEGGDWHNLNDLPVALQGIQTEDGWTVHWPYYGGLSYVDIIADFDTLYPAITFDIVDMNYPPYTERPVPGGGIMADTYTLPDVLDCDVFIPVASMKTHFISRITCMHKHYVGVSPATVYGTGPPPFNMNHGMLPHGDNIERVLLDLFSYHPADFGLIECFWGMEGYGPHAGIPIKRNVVLASSDPVALDATDAYVMGYNPWDIDHLHYSRNKGFGTYDLDYITVNGPALDDVRYEFIKAPRGPGYYLGRGNRIWLVNGTYDGSTDLDSEQLGAGVEASISPVPGQMTQGNPWTVAQFTRVDEYCDLSAYFGGPANCVSYAFTRIVADSAQTAYLRFGANDGMKIWLNGSVVYNQAAVGGSDDWDKVEDGVAISLTAGVNRLLLKISNASGGYGFSLITTESDTDGDTPLGIEYRVTATPAPDVVLLQPFDGAAIPEALADLSATVTDGDSDSLTVRFYGGVTTEPGDLLSLAEGVASGTHLSCTWDAPVLQATSDTRGLWHLNENTGTTVADASGNGNAGTITGATWTTAGKFGPALSFSGSPGDYLDVGNDPGLNPTSEITFEAWINVNQVTGAGPKVYIRDSCSAMRVRGDRGLNWELARTGAYTEVYAQTPAGTVPLGEWVYVAGTCDSNGVMHAYVNGELLGTANLGGDLRTASTNLFIGWWPDYHMDGVIDEVRVSDRALTEAEIQANYALGNGTYYWRVIAADGGTADTSETRSFIAASDADTQPPGVTLNAPGDGALFAESAFVDLDVTVSDPEGSPVDVWIYGDTSPVPTTLLYHTNGLPSPADILHTWGSAPSELTVLGSTVALWHFNENTGTTAADETGTHTGTIQNPTWEPGRFGSALRFGDSDRVEIPDSPDWDHPQLTVQAWVNASSLSSTYNCVVTKGSYPAAVDLGWALCVYDGQVVLLLGNADGSGWDVLLDAMGGTTLGTDTWYHVAATYDGSNVRIYMNGVLDANGSANPYAYTGGMHYSAGPVDIGSSLQQLTADSWDGLIDEVRISSAALTAAEIHQTFALAAGRYYWYATADDSAGNNAVSPTRYFDVVTLELDTLAPDIVLNAPADGAVFPAESSVDLDVTVSDPEGGAVEVWVYGDTSATPTTLLHHESGLMSPSAVLYSWGSGESEFTVTGNTVALWHFNENADTTASDETGGHDGAVLNATWAAGRFGSALSFGGDDRVEIPDSPEWNTPQLTLQAWVYATSLPSGYNCILTKGTLPDGLIPEDLGYALLVSDSGHVDFAIGNSDGSEWAIIGDAVSATSLSMDTWYHVAVTYDGAEVRIYINGDLDSNGTANPHAYTGGMHYAVGPIDIGSSLQRSTADSWFGLIDEVRISDVALSATEIQSVYVLEADRYYWFVTASDTLGNDSTSLTRYFDVGPVLPPDVPVLIAPPDAAFGNNATPQFQWSATAGAGGTYTLEYALDLGFTTGVQTVSGIADTSYTVAAALADDVYYWHVQAFNSVGDSSGYQTVPFSFTLDTQAPDVPALLSPPDLAVTSDDTPTFAWRPTAGAGGIYTLEWALDADFTTGVQTITDVTDSTYTPSGALGEDTYYWHVLAVDAAGNASAYQVTPFSFTVNTSQPAVPALILPADLALTNDDTPTFVWSATAAALGTYTLEYALDAGFTTGVQTLTDITDSTYTVASALGEDTYYWHVQAISQAGNPGGYQATPFSFTVDTEAPLVPVLILPPHLATIDDNTPIFTWSGTAGGGGTYTLQFASDPGFMFAVTVSGLTDTAYEESTPFMDGDYYWRVEAFDPAGNASGFQASPFSFTVDVGVPPIPVLLWPPDSIHMCDTTPAFLWQGANPILTSGPRSEQNLQAAGARSTPVTYTLQYGTDPTFVAATTVVDIADVTYTPPVTAPASKGAWYWRVEAVDEADHHSGYQAHPFRFSVFVAGDQNDDGVITASDVIYLVNYTFKGGDPPVVCAAVGDANCDGAVTAGDVIFLVNHTFKGGPAPCDVGALIIAGTWTCPW